MGNSINSNIIIIKNSKTWIEGNAIQQLETTAKLPNMVRVAGMPDLHAGRGYPVGAAFLSVEQFYPALIGNDIGCGMAFWQTDLPIKPIQSNNQSKKTKLAKNLGNIDEPLDETWAERIQELIPNPIYPQALGTMGTIGTIGGGNHFAELQILDTIYAPELLPKSFNSQYLQLLVHSGSRGLGQSILRNHVDNFGHAGLQENTPQAIDYLEKHDFALQFARVNRQLIAERMLARWGADGECLLDIHHNFLQSIQLDNKKYWLHRKGATPSDCGLVMIPGSRGDYSYLVQPILSNQNNQDNQNNSLISLFSLAHGAGRKWQRSECKGRLSHQFSVDKLRQTHFGSLVICEDKSLIYEEAPQAYKNIDDIIQAMLDFGLIQLVARFKPVLTYKTKTVKTAGKCC